MNRLFFSMLTVALFAAAFFGSIYFGYSSLATLAIFIFGTAYAATIFFTGVWIKIARNAKLTGRDINKHNGDQVAESGGMSVILGITFGILAYIFIKTFFIESETNLVNILAYAVTILLAGILGFIDDIIGWKTGLKQWQKPLLTLPIAIPLIVLNVGTSTMSIPFLGDVDFGLLYPLLIVPIAIIGAANGFNMLAGLNGLEAGLGAIIVASMGVFAFASGHYWLATLAGVVVFALLAFLVFNKHPAKVFPGDSLTYSIGATVAAIAILGNMEKIALVLFSLYFIELILKGRNRFKGESFGIPTPDGKLKSPQKTISMTHVSMKLLEKTRGYATEKSAVWLLYLMQALLALAVFYLWL